MSSSWKIEKDIRESILEEDYSQSEKILEEQGKYLKPRSQKDWKQQIKVARDGGPSWKNKNKDIAIDFLIYFLLFLSELVLELVLFVLLRDKPWIGVIMQCILYCIYHQLNVVEIRHYRNKWGFKIFERDFTVYHGVVVKFSFLVTVLLVIVNLI